MLLLLGAQQAIVAQVPDRLRRGIGEVVVTTLREHLHFRNDQFGTLPVGRVAEIDGARSHWVAFTAPA